MKMRHHAVLAIVASLAPPPVLAEQADYGRIELTGLARDVAWPLNRPGESNAMVCNVNGVDRFLTVRTGPGPDHPSARKLSRLAVVEVDTRDRQGRWVRVRGAYRNHTKDGEIQDYMVLPVTGWVHDGYLCDFIDYPAPISNNSPENSNDQVATSPELPQSTSKTARCEWDNGTDGTSELYYCEFIPLDRNGSFSVVRDDGYELVLEVDRPGVASVQEILDGRRGSAFGRFVRSEIDRACWESTTGTEMLCVR